MSTSRQAAGRPALVFLFASAWIVVALAAGRLAAALLPGAAYDMVREAATAATLLGGFYVMARVAVPDLRALSSVGFVRRPGAGKEFGLGAALGWAISLALVLPALLSGSLTVTFHLDAASMLRSVICVAVLAAFALVVQLVLSGLPVRLLVRAIGPGWTRAAVVFVVVCLVLAGPAGQGRSLLFAALAASLFCSAFLRTRAIWMPLGLQLGWTIGLQILFGATSPYTPVSGGIVQNDTGGPAWLTGGPFGPESSLCAIVVLLAAFIVLYRMTRDYAWHYTYQPITGAGYPVDVAPPAEHAKEEQRAAAAVPLVQIGGIAPAPPERLP